MSTRTPVRGHIGLVRHYELGLTSKFVKIEAYVYELWTKICEMCEVV